MLRCGQREAREAQLLPMDGQRQTSGLGQESSQDLPETLEKGVLLMRKEHLHSHGLARLGNWARLESAGGRDCKTQLHTRLEGKQQEK